MPLYRILKNLSTSNGMIGLGCIQDLGWSQDKLDILEERGAISRVRTPPLEELPNWEERAQKLLPSIVTAEEFLLASNRQIADLLDLDEREIEAIKNGVWGWLSPDGDKPCG